MEEIWKDIEGYEGKYQVSNLGRVRTNSGLIKKFTKYKNRNRVQLSKNNQVKTVKVARLVALAFVPNPYNKPCVDHIDSNPSNDIWTNLRWVTIAENNNNPNTIEKWKKHKRRIAQYDENGELIGLFDSIKLAAKVYDYSKSSICVNLKNKSASSHLCKWEYMDW